MSPRRLYLDNAATSFPKPRTVLEAMNRYAMELGASAGRGAYVEAIESGKLIETCRRRLNQLFNGAAANQFVFTLNCTEALNLAIKGLTDPLDATNGRGHAICTAIDHNSILRPLTALVERGWIDSQTRMPVDAKSGLVDPDDIRRAIRPDTKMIAITHASNVTGTVQPIREIGAIARERGIPFIVDAAQSAGHLPIDLAVDGIDLLAAPGHKGLLGPLGTGFLYLRPGLEKKLMPLVEGGTGSISEDPRQPDFMPDRFESGSHNAIGIAGLSEGVRWILDQGIERVAGQEMDLVRSFLEGVSDIDGLKYFGPQGVRDRTGVFSIRIDGIAPHELSAILETHYGILTRSGLHCAPLAHQTIGTLDTGGTTRFSFGPFLVQQDIKFVTDAIAEIVMQNAEGRVQNAESKAQN